VTVNKLQNYLLAAFAFTGVLANYEGPHHINNTLMLLFIASSFLTKSTSPKSKIFYYFLIVSVISMLNQMLFASLGTYNWNSHYVTVPLIAMLLYAVNRIRLNYSYETLVLLNVSPLIVLFLLGGFETVGGRINTEFITANLHGMLIFFGFMVSTRNVLQGKLLLSSFVIMVFTALFLILSGSRQNVILLLFGSFFLVYPVMKEKFYFKKYRLAKKIVLGTIMLVGAIFVVNKGLHQLSERFGDIQQVQAQLKGEETEYSMLERLNFIKTSFVTISEGYIAGVGHGNTAYALEEYGDKLYHVTNNSHSVIAEFLFSAGIIGALVLLMMLFRMKQIFWNKKKYRFQYGYILVYFSLAVFAIPLITSKIFWVLLVVLERQIMKVNKIQK